MSEKLNVILEFYRDNDRMIETVERVNDSYLEMLDALEVLEAENAKLRELAKGLYEFAYSEHPSAVKASFADDLCELGVKVK